MYTDYSGYCYDYNDENNDGSRDPDQGDGCGSGRLNIFGTQYWTNGGTFSNTYNGVTPGSTINTYSVNDVFSTGINSGLGNMISKYGIVEKWMRGILLYGSLSESSYVSDRSSAIDSIMNGNRIYKALKPDAHHRAASFLSQAQLETGYGFVNYGYDGRYTHYYVHGEVNDYNGVFHYIIDSYGNITHQQLEIR